MIEQLPERQIPTWLAKPDESSFEIDKVLLCSCYYPACGFDGTPVRNLAGNILSFVYTDYFVSRDEILTDLHSPTISSGFAWMGYECVFTQELTMDQILPENWRPTLLPTEAEGRQRFIERAKDNFRRDPTDFIYWTIWENKAENRRFSLLYIREEMSACYQGLYLAIGIKPKVLVIIQPGCMGGEWEAVICDDCFFKRVLMNHPSGLPDYLIYGGYGNESLYTAPCWQEYASPNRIRLKGRNTNLWPLKTTVNSLG